MVNALERAELARIGKRYSIDFQERPLPSEEEVQDLVIQRTLALLEAQLRERDRLQTERMQRFLPFLSGLGEESEGENEGTAGLAMLLDDYYHEAFHTAQMPQPEGKPWLHAPSRGETGEDQQRGRRRPGGHSDARAGDSRKAARTASRKQAPGGREARAAGDAEEEGNRPGQQDRPGVNSNHQSQEEGCYVSASRKPLPVDAV